MALMLPSDPVIKQIAELLAVPKNATGFTLRVEIGQVVRLTLDTIVEKKPDTQHQALGDTPPC